MALGLRDALRLRASELSTRRRSQCVRGRAAPADSDLASTLSSKSCCGDSWIEVEEIRTEIGAGDYRMGRWKV